MYLNYGEIGQTMKELMDEFQRKAKSQQKVESIADMKNFVETYPQFKRIRQVIGNSKVRDEEACKLVMLYALRYKRHSNNYITGLIYALKKRGVPENKTNIIYNVLAYGNLQDQSVGDIVSQEAVVKITKRFFKDLKGVENVYTQHVPLVKETLEDLIKGKLRENAYPLLGMCPPKR
ncbi:vacuolar protein sorting-associated protein 45-like [Lycorma delicatula]|uniref:vacuolar protein sorting-associated protein 45-like n=1 Tax=Lycorma delicatula TaxID=130591 RepID=UPI003F51145E